MSEPLLVEESKRYSLFPIKYHDLWALGCAQRDNFWRVEEATDLAADRDDWRRKLTAAEKRAAKMFLGFFNSSDQIVTENLLKNVVNKITIPEAQYFYCMQAAIEQIHSQAYSQMIDSYIDDTEEKQQLFEAIERVPAIKKKAEWAIKWINDSKLTLGERLVAFACVEGIFFSSAFAFIFFLGERNLLQSSYTLNKWIRRDEGLHTIFACTLLDYVNDRPHEKRIEEIVRDAVEVELQFVRDALPGPLVGLNRDSMSAYVRFVANHLLANLGQPLLFDEQKCPLEYMTKIDLISKENFFEHNVTQYSKSSIISQKLDMSELSRDSDDDW